ncbi:MAG TPA: tRNA (adenosine(37)-N6)-threonylcarbamoyltransferase complex ATPase subunit type 1 TsaE [bacterium]|jgi:tRNA threonylcarbamoyladenosine biosynthesis protein TsaE
MFQISSYGPDETRQLARQFALLLQPGDSVALTGDLGSGKTVFASGLCAGLGYHDLTTSPTFTLLHQYPTSPPIYHFDCFRLNSPDQIAATGFDDYIAAGQGIIIVEWADRIGDYFSDWAYEIDFTFDFESEMLRILRFSTRRAGYSKRLQRFLEAVLK